MEHDTFNRREFLGVTAGFALAVSPVTAWAVETSAEGLVAGSVAIPTAKGTMPGYWAMPKGKGPFPVVLVIHEIFGVHAYIQDVCRRLAQKGYLAVAPYLYFREGDVTVLKEIDQIRSQVLSKVSMPQVLADLDSTLAWIGTAKSGELSKVGITGFCWGGIVTWMYASHNPKVKAGVAWYGRVTGDTSPLQPKFPVDIAADLKVPVLGLYGGKDKGIPLEAVQKMGEGLKKGKSGSDIIVYPDAEHGFHADYRPSYNEKAAKEGWGKMLAWFKKNGVA